MPALKNFLNGTQQTVAEIRQAGIDQADRRRENARKKVFGAAWRKSRVAGDAGVLAREQDVADDVLQECSVDRRGFVEGQRRHQTGLGAARCRRLGHNGDAACFARGKPAVEPIRTGHTMPSPRKVRLKSNRNQTTEEQCLAKRTAAPITSRSMPSSQRALKGYGLHRFVIGSATPT